MNLVNLSIPLRTPSENGFFVHREAPEKRLFGFALGMRLQDPYAYLEVQGVPDAEAAEVFDKLRAILPWAALRLNFGILAGEGELRVEHGPAFDGQFPTVYPAHLTPRPIRVAANHQTQGADTLLFSALLEGAEIQALSGPQARPELRLACELFAAGSSFGAVRRYRRRCDGADDARGERDRRRGAVASAPGHAQGRIALEGRVD